MHFEGLVNGLGQASGKTYTVLCRTLGKQLGKRRGLKFAYYKIHLFIHSLNTHRDRCCSKKIKCHLLLLGTHYPSKEREK